MPHETELKVTLYSAFHRLYSRYKVRPQGQGGYQPYLSTMIQPITNLDELVAINRAYSSTGVRTTSGLSTVFTAPVDTRVLVQSLRLAKSAGTGDIDGVYLRDNRNNVTIGYSFFTATGDKVVSISTPFQLEPGDEIVASFVNVVTSATVLCELWARAENSPAVV